jgi:hypothetical protein
MRKLIRKIIIVLTLKDKTNKQIRDFARKTSGNAIKYSEDYSEFIPSPGDMIANCDAGDAIAREKAALKLRLKTLTEMENENRRSILGDLYRWVGIVQRMNNLSAALVKKMGWKIKSTGTNDRKDFLSSSPIVSRSDQRTSKTIRLNLLNSKNRKKKKPYGAKGWIPYTQIGGKKPIDHTTMKAGVLQSEMKYSMTLDAKYLGKKIYICFVWYDGVSIIGTDSPIYCYILI